MDGLQEEVDDEAKVNFSMFRYAMDEANLGTLSVNPKNPYQLSVICVILCDISCT